MHPDQRLTHLSRTWAEAGGVLRRVSARGASLGNRDRRVLREAARECARLARCLTGPSDELAMVQVAARLQEVVQPMVSRPLLVEQLFRAQDALAMLVESQPGLERLAVAPGQLAWLQEFLSECCLMLLRDMATRQLRHHFYAVGS